MKRLACPFCGPRDLREFTFHKTLPDDHARSEYQRTYERLANLELSVEHWQHVAGCRAWLLVRRNPSTGQVMLVSLVGAVTTR